jgi:hypothetical protein
LARHAPQARLERHPKSVFRRWFAGVEGALVAFDDDLLRGYTLRQFLDVGA